MAGTEKIVDHAHPAFCCNLVRNIAEKMHVVRVLELAATPVGPNVQMRDSAIFLGIILLNYLLQNSLHELAGWNVWDRRT